MKTELVQGKKGYRLFKKIQDQVYAGNPNHRGTEGSVEKMLILGPTAFHRHARVLPFLLKDAGETVGRFALIQDKKLPGIIQVSFFEALPGLQGVRATIEAEIKKSFPGFKQYVVGLNGHLNYGVGLLVDGFDAPPVFGLPYSQEYYPAYFSGMDIRKMFSYRLPVSAFAEWSRSYANPSGKRAFTVRYMDKKNLRRDITLYTKLNNEGFQEHPFWADRSVEEDMELFYPFRFFMDNENMIIAEYQGQPIGFFLWYPDFNQLPKNGRDFHLGDVLRFRIKNPIDTCRFTEIGVIPAFIGSPVALEMMNHALPAIEKAGYQYCEVGFIFEENKASIALCRRILSRCGQPTSPNREFAVYEGKL